MMDERKVKDIPKDERSQLIGQLDANTTFKEFFKKTDDFFQKEWLGPKRYKLYKEGRFDFDKFFDPEGRLYSLDELRKLDEKSFKELGL
ncbi:phage head morphogenesis domain protein [Acinetobacter pittii]|nr:phage head morphogenesis domain protein [Acinetobacter pittii]